MRRWLRAALAALNMAGINAVATITPCKWNHGAMTATRIARIARAANRPLGCSQPSAVTNSIGTISKPSRSPCNQLLPNAGEATINPNTTNAIGPHPLVVGNARRIKSHKPARASRTSSRLTQTTDCRVAFGTCSALRCTTRAAKCIGSDAVSAQLANSHRGVTSPSAMRSATDSGTRAANDAQ